MKLLRDTFEWQEYCRELDETGVAGVAYPFEHMNEPDEYPCVCETLIDDSNPGRVQLVHVFFTSDDAALLAHIPQKEPEEDAEG